MKQVATDQHLSADERLSADEQGKLARLTDLLNEKADAVTDAQLALARFQRALAVKYELRGEDTCDRFGFILRK